MLSCHLQFRTTALIITLYRAYYSNARMNIVGPGREGYKIFIWATKQC